MRMSLAGNDERVTEAADSAQPDLEYVTLPLKTQRAVEFMKEKGASSWFTVIPLIEMNFTLNKS